jgi:hypothetical protein
MSSFFLKTTKSIFIIFLSLHLLSCNKRLIYTTEFNGKLDKKMWKIETESGNVFTKDGCLVIDTKSGTTVWLNKKLKGNYKITYEREVVLDSGVNDRLSDFNQFWMAQARPFDRKGVFEEYDNTKLYYLGYGGNYNSTTRFRKYHGDGTKPVLTEYTDENYLLKPNHTYTVVTIVQNGHISCTIDGVKVVDYVDSEPIKKGYFGFRTTWSRQRIGYQKIERI